MWIVYGGWIDRAPCSPLVRGVARRGVARELVESVTKVLTHLISLNHVVFNNNSNLLLFIAKSDRNCRNFVEYFQ